MNDYLFPKFISARDGLFEILSLRNVSIYAVQHLFWVKAGSYYLVYRVMSLRISVIVALTVYWMLVGPLGLS